MQESLGELAPHSDAFSAPHRAGGRVSGPHACHYAKQTPHTEKTLPPQPPPQSPRRKLRAAGRRRAAWRDPNDAAAPRPSDSSVLLPHVFKGGEPVERSGLTFP